MTSPAFDYTMMSTFHICRRKYNYRINRGLTLKVAQFAPEFGRCIHAALDVLYPKWDVEAAVAHFHSIYKEDKARDDKRTNEIGEWILRNYAETYASQPWKLVASEMAFKVPTPWGTDLIGRIDKIIEWDGVLWVVDHKTTSGLGPTYFKMAEPNAQFMGYVYAARKLGYPVVGVVIDAILVAKGLLKAESRAKLSPLARYDAHYSDELMAEWETWAQSTQNEIASCAERQFYLPNYESCSYYGECPYRQLCKEIPALRERIIESEYKVEMWSPEKKEADNA